MQLHNLKLKTKMRRGQRIGRGGKRGTTSGRGTKGQKARAGAKIRPAIRDIMKKIPKRRGYHFRSFRPKPVPVDLGRIAAAFSSGATVDASALLAAGVIRKMKGKAPDIKVLGNRAIVKKLHLRGLEVSAGARARVEEAGGTIA